MIDFLLFVSRPLALIVASAERERNGGVIGRTGDRNTCEKHTLPSLKEYKWSIYLQM